MALLGMKALAAATIANTAMIMSCIIRFDVNVMTKLVL